MLTLNLTKSGCNQGPIKTRSWQLPCVGLAQAGIVLTSSSTELLRIRACSLIITLIVIADDMAASPVELADHDSARLWWPTVIRSV